MIHTATFNIPEWNHVMVRKNVNKKTIFDVMAVNLFTMHKLLEQESALLTYIVNKLEDPKHKV